MALTREECALLNSAVANLDYISQTLTLPSKDATAMVLGLYLENFIIFTPLEFFNEKLAKISSVLKFCKTISPIYDPEAIIVSVGFQSIVKIYE